MAMARERGGGGGGGGKGNSSSATLGSTRTGSGGKAVVLIELKHRILAALHKLSDRDTQQLAVEELERIGQSLTPEGITLFLACLYDTDAQQKSVVRRECIKLVGTLASLHGDMLAGHLPKMVSNIVRRLKDPDSNIRDACVDTIGVLAGQIGGAEAGAAVTVFVKPLLEALGEQNRNLQVGASLCLARVIDCCKDPHPPTLQRLCPRVVKLLANPNFLAKASLLTVVGGLVQVPGAVTSSQLPVLMSTVQDEFESSEWAVRKAAADTLACMATALGPALAPYKASATSALDSCRFDKVKPVRDSVSEALQLWKTVHDPSQTGSTPDSHDSPRHCLDEDALTPSMSDRKNGLLAKSFDLNSAYSDSSGRSKSLPEKRGLALKKRTPALSDKKTNPDFFRKLETARNVELRDSTDWQIEVAVPRTSPPEGNSISGIASCGRLDHHGNSMDSTAGSGSPAYGTSGYLTPKEFNAMELRSEQEEGVQIDKSADNDEIASFVCRTSKSTPIQDSLKNTGNWGDQLHLRSPKEEFHSWDANASAPSSNDMCPDWAAVRETLKNLERQQLTLMEMVQDSVARVHDSMQDLEGRVCRLENLVDDMAQNVNNNSECNLPVGGTPTFEGPHSHPLGKFISGDEFMSYKVGKGEEEEGTVPLSVQSQDSLEKMTESTSGDSDDFSFGLGHQMSRGSSAQSSRQAGPSTISSHLRKVSSRQDGDNNIEQVGNNRVRDQGSGPIQQGEGPSARSVWQASKDEAMTVAAIRGAAIPNKPSSHRKHTSRSFGTDQKPNSAGGPFWMLWSRAMESVRSGDLDVAYVDILLSGDELLLVRLMGRTGPVLQQLSPGTAMQLMSSIKRFLQQQSFLDCIIPWIQQVSDMVASNSASSLELTEDMKKDLVMALQDASTSEYAESWIGAKVSQLSQQLANAWRDDSSSRD